MSQNPVSSNGGHLPRLLLAVAMLLTSACQDAQTSPEPAAADHQAAAREQQIWESFYLQGSKIGYGHTTVAPKTQDDRELVSIDSLNHLSITRFGETTEQEVRMSTLETPDGKLLEFKTVVGFGPAPTTAVGQVQGNELLITTTTQGSAQTSRLPWQNDIGGFRAVEQSLAREPLAAGERRSLKMLMPLVNQIADVRLQAAEPEETDVLGVTTKLQRVESIATLPGGQSIASTLWTDATGEVIKTHVAALNQESFRTTEAIALAPAGKADQLDLGIDLFVKVEPPLAKPHDTSEVVYRVSLADADPGKIFATGPTQTVRPLGPHEAEITVRSQRPGTSADQATKSTTPAAEYLGANSILQLEDVRLRKMAAEARGEAKKPADVAVALEKYVHGAMQQKDFSQGFATAAEVAESRTGDCTEHAVLLAALARICGLPSRVAIGLVYVPAAGGFGYHMWTEVFIDDHWIPLDATIGRGGTSAAYLKLNDTSLEGASAYSSFLSVAQVLGQLKVSVVSAN